MFWALKKWGKNSLVVSETSTFEYPIGMLLLLKTVKHMLYLGFCFVMLCSDL